ncbi:MAG: hypothetical protein AAF411_20545 [Myxococcota bacterium]
MVRQCTASRCGFRAGVVLSLSFAAAVASAQPVVVVVESEHADVSASRVRAAMSARGLEVLSAADPRADDAASLAIVFTAPEEVVRFRLVDAQGEVHTRAPRAPDEDVVTWIAGRAASYLRASAARPRPTSEVLNPWHPRPDTTEAIANPWSGTTGGSIGAVAGVAATHFSEVLDPWSNRRTPSRPEVLDPWAREGGSNLPRPRRRRNR